MHRGIAEPWPHGVRGARKTRRATTNRIHLTMRLDEWQIGERSSARSTQFRCASESRMHPCMHATLICNSPTTRPQACLCLVTTSNTAASNNAKNIPGRDRRQAVAKIMTAHDGGNLQKTHPASHYWGVGFHNTYPCTVAYPLTFRRSPLELP